MGREIPVMEDEFELSLELSIGGCYAKSETKNLERENEVTPPEGDADSNREISRSDFSQTDVGAEEISCEFPDLQTRREIQALRRREARMKREVKKSRGLNRGGGLVDDRLILEAQQFHARIEERESRERDGIPDDSARKREKIGVENLNISLFGENKVGDSGRQQMLQAQFQLPVVNGFACPWVVPLWGSAAVAGERDGKNSGNVAAPSSWSGQRSSSAVSSHRSTSQKGGSCSGSGSHSSSFGTHQNQRGSTSDKLEHLEVNNSSSSQTEPEPEPGRCIGRASQDQSTKVVPSSIQQPQPNTVRGSTMRAHDSNLTHTTCSTAEKPSTSPASSVINKPPKLLNPSQNGGAPALHMPCVSTTGNGPNGKTITGFLYKYTNSEVSIMCVCHGSFFSPAEFVEHAGGIDVTHPLRHITVVPSVVE